MYFFDTGLVAYLTKHLTPEILMNGAMNGAILENYVVAEIMKTHSNNGMECVAHYYRDKDNKEIDLVLQSDLGLHPIEIKKTASPSPALSRAVALLDKSKSARGMGAVLCTKQELSAASADTAIVPIWMI
jgi:predicted AAA+ superfamily ATPase